MHKKTSSYKPRKYSDVKSNSKKSLVMKKVIIQRESQPSISASGPLEDYQPSAGLFEEKQDIEGGVIFQFTPLKSKRSLKEALSPATQSSSDTPKEESKGYSLRQRMKQELSSLNELHLESDPEDSDDEKDSDYEDIESEAPVLDSDAIKRRGKNTKSFAETYFTAQKQKKTATSNRTLSSLKLERTDIEQLSSILKNDCHRKEKEAMFKRYKSQFIKWKFLMHQGFNVLLYGVGSKQKLLSAFCEECLDDALYLVVNGFFPSLNFKQILASITEEALGSDRKFSNIHEHTAFIREYFSEGKDELYVVIHNIDGISLRNVKTQTLLSSLASVPRIHFVCSIDHINSPLMWDQVMLSHLRWVWIDVTTFEPYAVEGSYDASRDLSSSHLLLLSSLLHVFRSLTPNSQGVFCILARHQKQEKTGLRFHEWYQECREAFLVNSEITMQAQLSEFKNHKLLSSKKSVEGADTWFIPVDDITLEQFLESCK